ncbi:MAG: glycosyltransferase family 4 protein [Chitinophagales bacterium]|nr:glycosyltransferase family 4 protein [Chitinophagales bacterium]
MALKIGVVANTAFNIYNYRLGLMRFLKAQGHTVYAIAPTDDYTTLIEQQGFECIAVKHLSRKGTNPINDIRLLFELKSIYKKLQLDVVLQYTIKPNIYGTLASKLSNTKAICTITGLGYTFLNKGLAASVAKKLYQVALQYAHKVVFQNTTDKELFIQLNLVDKNKTAIVNGSGIDTDFFNPDYCSSIEKKNNQFAFLMVARLLKDKGIYEYIAAAKFIQQKYKQAIFYLIGDIDEDNPSSITEVELNEWINNKTISYLGYQKDIRPYYCMADVVVLPSYREGMPRVVLEALAMQIPVITTNAPGCNDAIDDTCGIKVDVKDIESLQNAMKKMLQLDETKLMQMRISSRQRAINVYSEKIICEFYQSVL